MATAIIDTLEQREETFRKNLKDSTGKVFKIDETTKIGESTIYRLWLKDRSYYYTSKAKKTQICIHFTVGSITGDIATLTKSGNHVSVHYVIDRRGNIYNLIPLDAGKNWSHHLGSGCIGDNNVMDKSAIGIELSNYGPLTKHIDGYYNTYKQLYCTEDRHVEDITYKDYDHYAKMTELQKVALYELVNWLCEKCDIPHNYKLEGMFENDKCAQEFKGIFTHAQVRKDKYDLPYEQVKFIKERWQESLLPAETESIKETAGEPVKYEDITFSEIRKIEEAQPDTIEEQQHDAIENDEVKPIDVPVNTEKRSEVKCSFFKKLINFIKGIFAKK